jgi:hypothetical protein
MWNGFIWLNIRRDETNLKIRAIWDDNIKMYHKEAVGEDLEWIHQAQYTVQWRCPVNTIMYFRFP